VDALYTGRWGGWVCKLCWSIQNRDVPEASIIEPAIKADEVLSWIRPRNLGRLERCPECKTESPVVGTHRQKLCATPQHPYGPCQVYEADFYGFSYGFRPGRSPHGALASLEKALMTQRVNWVLDVDVQTFFVPSTHCTLVIGEG
jgi:hypothetical protein